MDKPEDLVLVAIDKDMPESTSANSPTSKPPVSQPTAEQVWEKFSQLQPQLKNHIQFHRHIYRDDKWYVLQDSISNRQHRLSISAYFIVSLMDGKRTLQKIYELVADKMGDTAPDQENVIQLLNSLHKSELIHWNVKTNPEELSSQYQALKRQKWIKYLHNPLMLRLPLYDPDKLLAEAMPLVKPLFTWFWLAIWLTVVGIAAVQAGMHWSELSNNFTEQMFGKQSLIILFLCYPAVKLLHEMGHAVSTKHWGGEVHEMGILLMAFMPIPYVNASASASFPDKHRRIVVGASGIMVEMFLASLALFVWLSVETGIISAIAYNVMIIGGVSTLLFNGNPLLRFDGYYILSDLIDMPNLAKRASSYYGYLNKRYIFGIKDIESPVDDTGEQRWLVFYGAGAFCYRMIIIFTILMFVATKFFFFGVLFAIWAGISQICVPVVKQSILLYKDLRIQQQKRRAITTIASTALAFIVFFFVLPFPYQKTEEGVIWLPENARIRAGSEGFIQELLVKTDSMVLAGSPIIRTNDPLLKTKIKLLESEYRELNARYYAVRKSDRVEAQIIREEMANAKAKLKDAQQRISALTISSPISGKIFIPEVTDLPGKFLKQGDIVAYIMDFSEPTVRVAIPQSDIGLIRERTREVSVKFTDSLFETYSATIKREVPTGSMQLPSAVLGTTGGGQIAIDQNDKSGNTALEQIFQLDLALPSDAKVNHANKRVFVQFDFGGEPLAYQWYQSFRQLFLSHLSV